MLEKLTKALEALADPVRLRLMRLLLRGEACVCELVDALQLPQYAVSRHLRLLRAAGLVEARREGRWMHYRLAAMVDREPLYRDLLKALDAHLAAHTLSRADESRLSKALRSPRSCAVERRLG
jgi:ArsR family transcriptional regulator, arsenate/arsenite/antimonite-responsive transcriptional repressor